MKIIVSDKPSRTKRRRPRQRVLRLLPLAAGLAALGVGVFLWPSGAPPELYSGVDREVVESLFEFRADHTPQRLDVGGTIWSYLSLGEGPETVVFLHGFGGSGDIWWQQLNALSDRARVIAITFPSIRTLDEAAAGVRGVLEDQDLASAHIVGSSMGGLVAQFFAASDPDRVNSLVLANTFLPGEWIRQEVRSQSRGLSLLPTWMVRRGSVRNAERELYPASGGSAVVRDYLTEQIYATSRSTLMGRLDMLQQDFTPPDVDQLGIPTLVLVSANDPVIPESQRSALAQAYPTARVVDLGDVGHFPYLNRPAQYVRALTDFFQFNAPAPADSTFVAGDTEEPVTP